MDLLNRFAALMLCLILACFTTQLHAHEDCEPQWDGAIGQPEMNFPVFAFTVFDDGSGLALYAGGQFTSAGGSPAIRIADGGFACPTPRDARPTSRDCSACWSS